MNVINYTAKLCTLVLISFLFSLFFFFFQGWSLEFIINFSSAQKPLFSLLIWRRVLSYAYALSPKYFNFLKRPKAHIPPSCYPLCTVHFPRYPKVKESNYPTHKVYLWCPLYPRAPGSDSLSQVKWAVASCPALSTREAQRQGWPIPERNVEAR